MTESTPPLIFLNKMRKVAGHNNFKQTQCDFKDASFSITKGGKALGKYQVNMTVAHCKYKYTDVQHMQKILSVTMLISVKKGKYPII